ncbi:MAG: hypothetical protein GF333_00805 [Candidatus Omnitrophica bacterium]|nr:hypothetical protein [Candidatus Omnitrophota bacterium]
MGDVIRRVSITFTAGLVGGLANRLAIWIFGITGVTGALGVQFAPPLNVTFVYPGLIWGGIWGLIFLIPLMRERWVIRGFVYSILPSLVMLLVIFPFRMDQGMWGVQLGALMPVMVFFFNAIWGIVAAGWCRVSGE